MKKKKEQKFSPTFRKELRHAMPDPIGKPLSDMLLDAIEDAINIEGAGFAYSDIKFPDLADRDRIFKIEENTLFLVRNPDYYYTASYAFSLDVSESPFFTSILLYAGGAMTSNYWYFKIISNIIEVPHASLDAGFEVYDSEKGLLRFTIKIPKSASAIKLVVIPGDAEFSLRTVVFEQFISSVDYQDAFDAVSSGGGGGEGP